mgnify:FL=1
MELKQDGFNRYRLHRRGKMRVDAVIYANEHLLPLLREDKSLEQLANAACLPGVIEPVIGMPDIHEGFGLPIGGVMAVAADGVISAGAVGMDINCGVRLIRSDLLARDFNQTLLRRLIDRIEHHVPTGVGKKGKHKGIDSKIFEAVTHKGVAAIINAGFGSVEDLYRIEENGCLPGADIGAVSREAYSRGAVQLGTLGGGNHFIEIQEVTDIFDAETAGRFGLFAGQLTVMIHTGSRGLGHQVCTDYTKWLAGAAPKYKIELPNRGLACAPIDSPDGRNYYKAMACAVNFAFANRQIIMTDVMRAFNDVVGSAPDEIGMRIVYDVAHNIAKWEEHHGRRVLVHRKGATRALCPKHPANPAVYRDTGHPALVPGSMGTASYVLVGTEKAAETFFSVNHGAGRVLSRTAAEKKITKEEFERAMRDVVYNVRSYKEIVDEAPLAYKDIEQVVSALVDVGITRKVARMIPLAVVKGKD